jgi:uncharacterized protein YbaR (Trm112 family)
LSKQNYTISYCYCPECKHSIPIPRRNNIKRKNGHIKDLYCPYCNKVTKMTEVKEGQYTRNLDGDILEVI